MASNFLKKQIIIEFTVLFFFLLVIVYSYFTITNDNGEKLNSVDGVVTVLNDSNFEKLELLSDGQGLRQNAISYAVTNNNDSSRKYNVVIYPNVHDDDVLKNVRISVDDVYVKSLSELERHHGGYVITNNRLKSGYTKMHTVKIWYQKDMDIEYVDINFEYDIELV